MLNTQVDVQSEVYAEYASTRVTEAAEVGSIHISRYLQLQLHLIGYLSTSRIYLIWYGTCTGIISVDGICASDSTGTTTVTVVLIPWYWYRIVP